MDLENIILSEVSQAEEDKYSTKIYMESKKYTNGSIYKSETDSHT